MIKSVSYLRSIAFALFNGVIIASLLVQSPAEAQVLSQPVPQGAQTSAQNTERLFTVYGLKVEETARDASTARSNGLEKIQQIAFVLLIRKITAPDDDTGGLAVDGAAVRSMVRGIEVVEERTSPGRYFATVNVSFWPEKVKERLGLAGIPFTEVGGGPYLILPLFKEGGVTLLWEDSNRWDDVVYNLDLNNRLISYRKARGDFQDKLQVNGASLANGGDPARFEPILARYGANNILVLEASWAPPQADDRRRLNFRYQLGIGAPETSGQIVGFQGETETDMLKRAGRIILDRLDLGWKESTLTYFGEFNRLTVNVSAQTIDEWVKVTRQLTSTPIVRGLEMKRIGIPSSDVSILYTGGPQQLALALRQVGLSLEERDEGWQIVLIDLSDGS